MEVAMARVRRWAGLLVASLALAGTAAGFTLAASTPASAAPARPAASTTPVQMNYACTSQLTQVMRYVSSPANCGPGEKAVTIAPGPVYVCILYGVLVRQVAAPSDCSSVTGITKELTLPPTTGPVYFCASTSNGTLAYTTSPSRCGFGTFPVVVPVPHTAPVLANIETTALPYVAGAPPVPITSTLTVSSADATTLASATVTISSGLVAADDTLGFTSQNGITGSYSSSTGVLTLSGTASLADYQTALRSVTYSANGTTPAGSRTVSFQVNDGFPANNLSNVVSRTITVAANTPPTCSNVSASTDKHTAIDINVLSSCSDPDGDTLTVTAVNTTGTKGSVSINGNGTVHYDPNGQFDGLTQGQTATDTFTATVSDGFTITTTTVTVTINGVNDKPVIASVETTPLAYRAQTPPVAITSTLTISDDDDSTMAGATVSITSGLDAAADLLSFTNANGITGSYDSSAGVLTLTGNASIADYQAALRSVEFSTQDNSTSPAARTISFQVTDSVGAASNTATRTIDVGEAAMPPTAVDHSYTAVGNTPLGVGTTPTGPAATVGGSLLNGDSDPSDPSATLTVTANSTPGHGSVTVNPDGTFTYTPDAGFSGTDTFTYTIAGSNAPSKTATATVTITVGPVVWYVNDSLSAAGTGQAGTPFNTLAAANSAAGANSVIFLYQGNATYTGGVTLKSGEDLWGQPFGLVEDGYTLVTAGGSNPVITNSGGDGIDLGEGSDVEAVNVSSPSGNGVAASGIDSATVGGSSTVAISGAGGDGVHISGGHGTLNFSNVTVTGSAGHSVSIASRAGGTATLAGTITDHGTGISLSGNSGATINFGGVLTISTGAHPGFSATGGGTVTATGVGSTITTTTATALNVSSTTIGSDGLSFQSISSNGANPGISLSSTGTSGGLTVTGTGTAGSGGTIQGSAGEGIELSSTSSPSFTDMIIEDNAADGINGSQVNGLTLAASTVLDNGTAANVSVQNDDGLDFSPNGTGSPNGLTGTVSITNTSVTGSADNGAIISDTSGTLDLTVTGSTFSTSGANEGFHVDANNAVDATVSITGSTFASNAADAFQFSTGAVPSGSASGTESVTFSSNTVTGNGDGAIISPTGTSKTTITIDSNTIQSTISGNCIGLDLANSASGGSLSGTISGNTVGVATTANSGCGNGIGISAEGVESAGGTFSGGGTETLAITNNKFFQYQNEAGIHFIDRQGNPTMNMTITGNTIADPGKFGSWGILGEDGALTTDNGMVCAAVAGNSITGSAAAGQGGADVELDQNGATTFDLAGYTGGTSDTAAVQNFLQVSNTPGGGTAPSAIAVVSGSGGGFVGVTSCPAP
jgi:VCBS repeat-containing protein